MNSLIPNTLSGQALYKVIYNTLTFHENCTLNILALRAQTDPVNDIYFFSITNIPTYEGLLLEGKIILERELYKNESKEELLDILLDCIDQVFCDAVSRKVDTEKETYNVSLLC